MVFGKVGKRPNRYATPHYLGVKIQRTIIKICTWNIPDVAIVDILAAVLSSVSIFAYAMVTIRQIRAVAMHTWVWGAFVGIIFTIPARVARWARACVPRWITAASGTILALIISAIVTSSFATLSCKSDTDGKLSILEKYMNYEGFQINSSILVCMTKIQMCARVGTVCPPPPRRATIPNSHVSKDLLCCCNSC